MEYRKQISTLGLFMVAAGGMIGSGWLFGPLYAAQIAGPAATIAWAIGGLMMLLIALTFTELASRYPMPGGMVRYAHLSHGPLVSFAIAWVTWLASIVITPLETLALLQYSSNYVPGIMTSREHPHLTLIGIATAAVLMLLLCYFNSFGAKWFSKSNTGIVIWKLIIPVIAIVALFSMHFDISNFSDDGGFFANGMHGVLAALPSAGIVVSFIGYGSAIQLSGEAKDPHKSLPIAIVGALCCAILIYVLLEIAFVGALPKTSLNFGWDHLHFVGDAGPLAGLLGMLGAVWLVKLLYLDAIISPLGTAYIYTATSARTSYAMAENRQLARALMKLNDNGVPVKAMLFNFCIGMVFFLPFPGWQEMVSFLVSCFVLCYAIGPIALICMRKRDPGEFPSFHMPFSRLSCLIAFYFCNLILFWSGWETISKMYVLIVVGYILFFIKKYTRLKDMKLDWHNAPWLLTYLAAMGICSYLGSFGGGRDMLTFGPDFVAIGVLTLVIFYWATRVRD